MFPLNLVPLVLGIKPKVLCKPGTILPTEPNLQSPILPHHGKATLGTTEPSGVLCLLLLCCRKQFPGVIPEISSSVLSSLHPKQGEGLQFGCVQSLFPVCYLDKTEHEACHFLCQIPPWLNQGSDSRKHFTPCGHS